MKPRSARLTDWSAATRHLSNVEPRLAAVIERVGPCRLAPRRDHFVALCHSIYSQQISTKVAATLFGRFRDLFPNRRPTPTLVVSRLAAGNAKAEASLAGCGLSRQKRGYLLDLAEHFVSGKFPSRRLAGMSNQEIIDALIDVNGVGRWTAEMFLMFVLNRPDVLPVGDLGLQQAVKEVFELPERPTPAAVTKLAEPWRPFRSIATWYLWRRNSAPT